MAEKLMGAVVGLGVALWFFPFSGTDDQPPHHFNVFGQEIPNSSPTLALLLGLGSGLLTWHLLAWARRR